MTWIIWSTLCLAWREMEVRWRRGCTVLPSIWLALRGRNSAVTISSISQYHLLSRSQVHGSLLTRLGFTVRLFPCGGLFVIWLPEYFSMAGKIKCWRRGFSSWGCDEHWQWSRCRRWSEGGESCDRWSWRQLHHYYGHTSGSHLSVVSMTSHHTGRETWPGIGNNKCGKIFVKQLMLADT